MRQQVLRDIKILADAHEVPGLLSFLGAYFEPAKQQVCAFLKWVLMLLGRMVQDTTLSAITGVSWDSALQ